MKRLAIAFIVLIILVGAYLGLRTYSFQEAFQPPEDFKTSQWNEDMIDRVEMTFNESTIDLVKTDTGWTVNNFEANTERIQQVLDALNEAEISSLVSSNQQNHERFEVNGKGVRLNLYSGEEMFQEMLIGKSAGGDSVYVRLPEKDTVYVLSGYPRYLVSKEMAIWRDRHVFDVNTDDIRLVGYGNWEHEWIMKQNDEGWQIQRDQGTPMKLDTKKVQNWMTGIEKLQASEFPEEERDLETRFATITIETGTAEEFSERSQYKIDFDEDKNAYYVDIPDKADLLVPEDSFTSTFQSFNGMLETLKADEEGQETQSAESAE